MGTEEEIETEITKVEKREIMNVVRKTTVVAKIEVEARVMTKREKVEREAAIAIEFDHV